MQTANLANRALREADAGHVWEEVLSGAAGTVLVQQYQTFRIRAAAAVTVTIEGRLAATMVSGEIMIFNAGNSVTDPKTVNIVITGTAFMQVARNLDRVV